MGFVLVVLVVVVVVVVGVYVGSESEERSDMEMEIEDDSCLTIGAVGVGRTVGVTTDCTAATSIDFTLLTVGNRLP
jgi:uncharacterized protein (UPF0333 family)